MNSISHRLFTLKNVVMVPTPKTMNICTDYNLQESIHVHALSTPCLQYFEHESPDPTISIILDHLLKSCAQQGIYKLFVTLVCLVYYLLGSWDFWLQPGPTFKLEWVFFNKAVIILFCYNLISKRRTIYLYSKCVCIKTANKQQEKYSPQKMNNDLYKYYRKKNKWCSV